MGDYVFEPSTGRVRPVEVLPSGSDTEPTHLPPKPAALLELLIEAEGDVVGHEQIREALWPDVHVDFDQNLRFCVRQVRAAFGDSAREPRYVGTVPKRGYRLLAEAAAFEEVGPRDGNARDGNAGGEIAGKEDADAPGGATESDPVDPVGRRIPRWALIVAFGLLLYAAVDFGLWHRSTPELPVRLAIVPFELAAEGERSEELAQLGEWLLAELVSGRTEVLEVVGPRSTARYASFPFPDLDALASELEIDFVLNARPLEDGDEHDLIVELIRLRDGAHPFARYYDDDQSWRDVGASVLDEVVDALGLPSEP